MGLKVSILDRVIRLDLVSELGCNLESDHVSVWIVYRIGNNFEEPHLGLKGSILDRVIGLDLVSELGCDLGPDRVSDWQKNLTWD